MTQTTNDINHGVCIFLFLLALYTHYLPLLGGCYVYSVTIKVLLAVRGDNLLSDSNYILLESDYILLESDDILLESKTI